LRVFQFRNLADQTVELGNGPVFVTGPNGNGKTNVVEAVFLLSGSRSFRTNSASDYSRWGTNECSVFGHVWAPSGDYEIGIAYKPGKRDGFLNGNAVTSIADLLGKVVVVSFSPADLTLVKGPPAGRRKFLDRHMVDLNPGFLNVLMSYQRALASKSALLKSGMPGRSEIEPWNVLLARYGFQIATARREFLKRLQERAAELHREYAASDGELTLTLESDFSGSDEGSEEKALEKLDEALGREVAQRTAIVGPHRDDVDLRLGGVDSRSFASQGQARSIVLSMKLAVIDLLEGALNDAPIVLLDDVDSELDAQRGERLFDLLMKRDRQLLVTGTGEPPYRLRSHPALTVLRMEHGIISRGPE
jgi:DNA replication and repair protein RecF